MKFFTRKPKPTVITVKPSDEEQLKLAELYDAWKDNEDSSQRDRVAFLLEARRILRASSELPQDQEYSFIYDTHNGYLDVTL